MSEIKENTMNVVNSAEEIAAIVELATNARKPYWLERPGRGNVFDLVGPDGTIISEHRPPMVMAAISVNGFAEMVKDYCGRNAEGTTGRVYIDNSGPLCVIDDCGESSERRHMIRLSTTLTGAAGLLNTAKQNLTDLDQKKLIWLLRTCFKDAVTPPAFSASVRKLKFRSNSEGTSDVQVGRHTVDRSIEQEIAGLDAPLSEEIVIATPVFQELVPLGFSHDVPCAVDLNLEEQTFKICPLDGEVEIMFQAARDFLHKELLHHFQDAEVVGVLPDASPFRS